MNVSVSEREGRKMSKTFRQLAGNMEKENEREKRKIDLTAIHDLEKEDAIFTLY